MNIGISLSTVKEYISDNKSFLDTCKLLKEMGYSHLGYINLPFDLNRIKKEIEEVKLDITLVMMPLEKVLNEAIKIMKDLKSINCFNIAIEAIQSDNEKRCKQTIKSIDEIAKILNQNGFKLCYHISASDFVKFEKETLLDYILENTKYVSFIFDFYSAVKGGVNLEEYLIKLKGKVEFIFLNDYKIIINNNMTESIDTLVGLGNINYKEIIPLFKKYPCKNYMVYNTQTKNQFMKLKDTYDLIEKWK